MTVIVLQVLGWAAFIFGTFVSGRKLRQKPDKATAEGTSRIVHGLFFGGLVIPGNIGVLYPGIWRYDRLLGVRPLPWRPLTLGLGSVFLLAGSYFMITSNMALRRLGHGANAFRLTTETVVADVYERTRNPMSLGYYLCCLGVSLLAGSRSATIAALAGIIPAHLFALKYLEEPELELRLGPSYLDYKRHTPFLIPRLRS